MEVEQGSPAVVWAHFLKRTGEEATITGTPTITIRHYQANTAALVTDVSAQNMTQASGSLYYYIWSYTDIVKSSFAATISATYDTGESVTGTQVFTIRDLKIFGGGGGVWAEREKDDIISVINKIVGVLKGFTLSIDKSNVENKNSVDDINKAIAGLSEQTERLSAGMSRQDDYIKKLIAVEQSVSSIKSDVEVQNKLLVKLSDLDSLEKVLKDGGKR